MDMSIVPRMESTEELPVQHLRTNRVERALDAIRMAFLERMTLADLEAGAAEQLAGLVVNYLRSDVPAHGDDACGIEPFGFGRGLRRNTYMTPPQYVIYCRLRRAMALLERDDLDVESIALEVGCLGQNHLTYLFSKHVGTTPTYYRKAVRDGCARPDPL